MLINTENIIIDWEKEKKLHLYNIMTLSCFQLQQRIFVKQIKAKFSQIKIYLFQKRLQNLKVLGQGPCQEEEGRAKTTFTKYMHTRNKINERSRLLQPGEKAALGAPKSNLPPSTPRFSRTRSQALHNWLCSSWYCWKRQFSTHTSPSSGLTEKQHTLKPEEEFLRVQLVKLHLDIGKATIFFCQR